MENAIAKTNFDKEVRAGMRCFTMSGAVRRGEIDMHATPFDECGAAITQPRDLIFIPTAADIAAVCVGGMAIDCFGNLAEVVEVHGRGVDVNGKAYVCYDTKLLSSSTVSGSMKEDELVRHLRLTRKYSSQRLREIEKQGLYLRNNTHELICSCGAKFTVTGAYGDGELCASCLEIYK